MRIYKLSILLLIISACTNSSKNYKIKQSKSAITYANTITAKELKQHLSVIASDGYMGRETGTEGQRMAADYLRKELKKDGVQPGNKGSYFQKFPLIQSSVPQASIHVHGNTYQFGRDFYFFQNNMSVLPFLVNLKNDVIFIGNGEPNDYNGKDVKGKTLVISLNKKGWNWRKKIDYAQEKGAKIVLFTSTNFESNLDRLKHYLNKKSVTLKSSNQTEKKIPHIFINELIKQELKTQQAELSEEEKINNPFYNELSFECTSFNKTIYSTNVLGLIEGSDKKLKDEIVIITAHYDHLGIIDGNIYNGADDDGTGTVALLEIAEAFQKAKNEGNGPKRSILIMPVSGEEKGLLGSKYYTDNPVYPIENTIVDLNIDMIGRIDEHHNNPNYVYVIGADKISKELHLVNDATNKTYTKLELDYRYNDEKDPNRFYYRSDHYNFAQKGIPVIFYFSGVHEDYHKHTDEIDKIMFEKVEKITRLVFHTAWEVANKPKRLKID